jgi:hypothetical protein
VTDTYGFRAAVVMAILTCFLLWRDYAIMGGCGRAHGQDRPYMSQADQHTVKVCLVAEAHPGPDYLAILTTLSRRGPLAYMARHYCNVWVTHHPSPRQEAIRRLPDGPGARPYRYHWRKAGEALEAFLGGARAMCVATDFGDAREDARRMRRAHMVPVDCGTEEGPTANLFWTRPPVRVANRR